MENFTFYTPEDGKARVNLSVAPGSAWLTQAEITELFHTTRQNVSLHAKNIFDDDDLSEESVVKDSLTAAADGKNRPAKLSNLDRILAIGYRYQTEQHWVMSTYGLL